LDGEQGEADQDSLPAVDRTAEIADGETRHGHAHGARIDGKSDGCRHDAVVARKRGKNGLSGEQVDHGEEGRECDDDEAKDRALGVIVDLGVRGFHSVGHLGHGAAPKGEEGWM